MNIRSLPTCSVGVPVISCMLPRMIDRNICSVNNTDREGDAGVRKGRGFVQGMVSGTSVVGSFENTSQSAQRWVTGHVREWSGERLEKIYPGCRSLPAAWSIWLMCT